MAGMTPQELMAASMASLAASQPDRDIILISQPISRKLHYDLSMLIAGLKNKRPNVTVVLTTFGGDPDGGYRMARCLQHHYSKIRLLIPSMCKSAGTLVAIGAHEIVIGDLGELGPLDIQVRKQSELEERSSGLDIIQALEAVQGHARQAFNDTLIEIRRGGRLSTKLAGEFAANVAIGVAAPLYNQIDPNRLGEMQRAMRIAHEYGQRLDACSKSLRKGALDNLVASYPAHSFVIDRKEAANLFTCVKSPTAEEAEFCKQMWSVVGEQAGVGPFFVTDESATQGENDDQTVTSPGAVGEGQGDEGVAADPIETDQQAPGEAD